MNQDQVQIVNQNHASSGQAAPIIPAPLPNKISFENDFGKEPLLLAHLTRDGGTIAILSLAGAFIGAAFGGLPIAGLILLAGINDLKCASSEPHLAEQPVAIPTTDGIDAPVLIPIPQPEPMVMPQDYSSIPQPQPVTPPTAPTDGIDIALEMGKILKSTIIAASPRVGKGVLIVKALEYIKQFHPETEIWLLDPKDEPSESHYWQSLEASRRCHYDIRDFDIDTEKAAEVFSSFLIRFNQSQARSKLLIVDEFVNLNQKLPNKFMTQLKDFLVGICSGGELNLNQGIGRFAWCITQSPYVTDLGFKTKAALTTFQRILLINEASSSFYLLAASASFAPEGCKEKVSRMLERHERICYYSKLNSWQPIPNYNLPQKIADRVVRRNLEALLPSFREVPGSSPEVTGSSGSNERNPEAPEAQWEVGLPGIDGWRKYFPEAPEVVEEALFFAYWQALEVEGGKKNFISQILKSGEGGRKYQAATAYLDYLSQKFS